MRQIRYLQTSGDITAAAASLVVGFVLRFSSLNELRSLTGYVGEKVLVYVLVLLFSTYFCGLYERNTKFDFIGMFSRLAVAVMLAFFILSTIYYAIPALFIGRGFLSISLLFFALFHSLLHSVLKTFDKDSLSKERILVYGAGEIAESVEKLVSSTARGGYTFLGYILPEGEAISVPKHKVLGAAEKLEKLVETSRPHTLVISVVDKQAELPVRKLLGCKIKGVKIFDTATFFERFTGKLLLEEIQPNNFVFSNGFQLSRMMRILKRSLDIALASLGLILCAPFFPLLAVAIKLDSPGSIFYTQIRVGENDKPFKIYKLRTMRTDAELENGAVWAAEQDSRVTRLGRFLRKTRLDEVPQFYNILRGEMSMVGPRPERPEFVEELNARIPFYSKRHIVKPGLTGWAQVSYSYGASEDDAREKLRYDLYYIKNYSMVFELLILLETIKVVCFWRGGR